MYAVIYGDMENGENIEVEGLFQTHVEAVKALYESASKTFDSMNIDIDRKSTRLNSSHVSESRMPSSA